MELALLEGCRVVGLFEQEVGLQIQEVSTREETWAGLRQGFTELASRSHLKARSVTEEGSKTLREKPELRRWGLPPLLKRLCVDAFWLRCSISTL